LSRRQSRRRRAMGRARAGRGNRQPLRTANGEPRHVGEPRRAERADAGHRGRRRSLRAAADAPDLCRAHPRRSARARAGGRTFPLLGAPRHLQHRAPRILRPASGISSASTGPGDSAYVARNCANRLEIPLKQDALSTHDGLPPPQRRWAILTICLAIFITVIDQTIVNVALPTIGADLKIDPPSSVWIVNAYQVAIMLSLLPLASVGDILGYKRVYLAGLTLFGLASLGCALAPSLFVLTGMRVVQGLG